MFFWCAKKYKQKGTFLKLEYCYRNVSEYLNDASERSPADSQPKCEYTIQLSNLQDFKAF